MNESKTIPFLTLDLDIGPRYFSDLNELQTWVDEEYKAFEWLLKAENGSPSPVWGRISQWLNVLSTFIANYRSSTNEEFLADLPRQLKAEVKRYHKEAKVKSSESADAQFVFSLRPVFSDFVASYALRHLMGHDFSFNTSESMEGVFLALQYKKGSPDTVEAVRKELEALKTQWATRFKNQLSALKGKEERLTAKIAEYEEVLAATGQKFNSFHGTEEEKFQSLYKTAQKELSDISATYKVHMSLEASVTYWTEKKEHHDTVMWCMGVATAVSGAWSIIIFMDKAREFTIETVTNAPLGKLGILIAISTAGIWITRLCAKIFVSNMHLGTEARERITMMKTYLALMSEGKAPPESDRSLMLQTLFRGSSAGLIREDGPAGFLELLKWFKKD